jgi:recombination protein RecA
VLGGGYPVGRIVNVVGDKSTGKTLLAIEACANFAATWQSGLIWYNEAEAAFDKSYAAVLGLPVERVKFTQNCFTVEDFYKDLTAAIDESNQRQRNGLYILDSLDALSDKSELERGIDDSSYGAAKAKKLSELFRRLVQKLEKSRITVLIISQVRDAIGVTFGDKHSRSGGKALDFYASQVVYLSQIKTLKRTIKGVERPTGIQVRAKAKKNKIGPPLRECEFDLRFGYGVDDLAANVHWLTEIDQLKELGTTKDKSERFLRSTESMEEHEYRELCSKASVLVKEKWAEIETGFMPTRRKYL